MSSSRLPFDEVNLDGRIAARDRAARERAVDPRFNVALEASAGTGKTRVLVDRYVNLLRVGVDPANILAITFTRKAAGEMRERIMGTLRTAAARGEIAPSRWRELRDRTGDISISTIDAFCLSLLREFPLEADLDPGFSIADDTELPRFVDEALDRTIRICRGLAREDEDVALVFAQLGERRTRAALAALLERRLIAPAMLTRYLSRGPSDLDVGTISRRAAVSLIGFFQSMRGGLDAFVESGPLHPAFDLLVRSLRQVHASLAGGTLAPQSVRAAFSRASDHFLTQEGIARSRSPYPQKAFANATDWRTHSRLVVEHAQAFAQLDRAYRRDLNVLLSRGVWRMFRIGESEYRRALDAHAVLDFSDLIQRALDLLRRMEEFSRSRYRLESRYHHVLVDEFQDTSRPQWELVSLLVQSWGEGAGLADTGPLPPSIFIVGDRKQSIYGFRDADVSVLREAARHIETLRPDRDVRRSISRSFRAVPSLLAFVNDVCGEMEKTAGESAFQYDETDRFPIESDGPAPQDDALGMVLGADAEECAEIAAHEIARLLAAGTVVRDRETGLPRPVRPGDIAILFRSRESHREFEALLARYAIPSYVYKGLGFFDSDEVKDVLAVVQYLADPASDLRAAALLRSRVFGLSDLALRRVAPRLADALMAPDFPSVAGTLDAVDGAAFAEARASTARWRALVDRVGPAELIDLVLTESAYAFEMRGPRLQQARENLKKLRALLRRLQNRGYLTLGRVAAHLDRVAVGDESNAVIDALDAVNLMTVHASKGLEFPVVFVVNLTRGTGNRRSPVRWSPDSAAEAASVAVGDDLQPETDDRLVELEREETKRLVYVAFTRARDRLYLGAHVKDGRVTPSRGSLAEVLPQSLLDLTGSAGAESLEWRVPSGATHRFRVCPRPPATVPAASEDQRGQAEGSSTPASDFAPLRGSGSTVRTVSSLVQSHDRGRVHAPDSLTATAGSQRLVGTLVHRMLQRFGFDFDPVHPGIDSVRRLLRSSDVAGMAPDHNPAQAAAEAISAYRAICAHPDVRNLYESGKRLHEVPFTMDTGDGTVRGTIDCLVCAPPGRVTVLEFKTGRPHESDSAQLDLYRRAAERLFPGTVVDARLVYPEQGR